MKRSVIILLAAVLTLSTAGMIALAGTPQVAFAETAVSSGSAEAAAPKSLITVESSQVKNGTITAGNNVKVLGSGDVVKFGFKGESDPMININLGEAVDTAEYPILAIKAQQTGAAKLGGEVFYNEPGSGAVGGKSVKFQWADTSEWQWLKGDLSGCGNVGYLRFDVFDTADVNVTGMIAAVAFFKTADDADAFSASEQGLKLGTDPGPESVLEEIKQEEASYYYLYDKESSISTGWWYAPYAEGKSISAYFESTVWFNKVWFFAYASQNPCPILLTILNDNEDEVFSRELGIVGNDENLVDLGIALPPGYYTIMFDSVEVDEDLLGNIHFVLGSAGECDVEVELTSFGGNTNDNTQTNPAIRLVVCEPDPNYTEKLAATPKATDLPTPVPTSVPSPVATEAPTAGATDGAGTDVDHGGNGSDSVKRGGNNTGLVVGIVVAGVVLVAAIAGILAGLHKKKK